MDKWLNAFSRCKAKIKQIGVRDYVVLLIWTISWNIRLDISILKIRIAQYMHSTPVVWWLWAGWMCPWHHLSPNWSLKSTLWASHQAGALAGIGKTFTHGLFGSLHWILTTDQINSTEQHTVCLYLHLCFWLLRFCYHLRANACP